MKSLILSYLILQLVILGMSTGGELQAFIEHLRYLDVAWYEHIASHGYTAFVNAAGGPQPEGATFAFFPLWPLLLALSSFLTAHLLSLPILGALLSLGFFVASLFLLQNSREFKHVQGAGSLVALTFAPGAWVFATGHTEGLFLFLSLQAFLALRFNAPQAGLWVGLACLTRNQGALLILSGALYYFFAALPKQKKHSALVSFLSCSIGLAALWPLYLWIFHGDPTMSLKAQQYWARGEPLKDYLGNLVWISAQTLPRKIVFWSCIGVAIHWLVGRAEAKDRALMIALGIYVLLSALLWPLQGHNLPQAYRFSAVLFMVWMFFGRQAAHLLQMLQRRDLLTPLATAIYLFWHVYLGASYYFQFGWPY